MCRSTEPGCKMTVLEENCRCMSKPGAGNCDGVSLWGSDKVSTGTSPCTCMSVWVNGMLTSSSSF